MSLNVIGAGFGRTGTDSMREALNILGFGPCHHMHEVMKHDHQKALWRGLVQGQAPDFDALFAGYTACVDWPSVYYWEELVDLFPEAKVVLTWRSAESWWASMSKTILPFIKKDEPKAVGPWVIRNTFGTDLDDKANAISVYEDHVARVKAKLPADRLLVYELGSGWEPLCTHLGVEVPEIEYPRRNNAAEFNKNNRTDEGAK